MPKPGCESRACDTRRVERFNLLDGDLEREGERDGYRRRSTRVGERIGATQIGGSVYELPEGEATFPYHFHHGVEEWLVVVAGTPRVRTPGGERELRRGDVMCFPSVVEGAHRVRGPGRVLILSANRTPSISVYPDSNKLGTRPDHEDYLNFRRGDAVDYWDGE
jgi:uncharacterized cupin superfamily protein